MAVPVYFSVQLLAAIFFAHRTMQEATATSSGVAEHAPA
jgi:hypothetical protein